MIYILKSSGFYNNSYIDLIKIGYTNNWRKRLDQYKMHNPTIQVLYKFDDGTEDDEKSLHQYFSQYRYSEYGNEWFKYNESIINFFKNNLTIEEIRKHLRPVAIRAHCLRGIQRKTRKTLIYQYSYFASTLIPNKTSYDFRKLLLNRGDIIELKDIQEWFRKNYSKEFPEIDKHYSNSLQISNQDNIKTKEFFEIFDKLPDFQSKLKYLCESDLEPDFIKSSILQNIKEPHFDEYYCVLGPSRCKALGYHTTRLKEELKNLIVSDKVLDDEIYKEFSEGQKIANSDAKKKLQSIYDSVGYSKKAKATDLEKYFEIKKITIQKNPTINGIELLKKK